MGPPAAPAEGTIVKSGISEGGFDTNVLEAVNRHRHVLWRHKLGDCDLRAVALDPDGRRQLSAVTQPFSP
jgi:hypothetical protein